MLIVACDLLGGSGGVVDASGAAVERYMIVVDDRVSLHDGAVVVGVVNDGVVHMHDGSVIGE